MSPGLFIQTALMGIETTQYRASIGIFNLKPRKPAKLFYNSGGTEFTSDFRDAVSTSFYTVFSILYTIALCWDINFCFWHLPLLLAQCGDVHPHPGPNNQNTFANLNFCHINIRSINAENRWTAFFNQVKNTYDIITTSETWLGKKDSDTKFQIPGYTGPYRLDRPRQKGGGIMVWVTDSIIAKRRDDLSIPDLETLWIQLDLPQNKILLATCYR